MAELRKMNKTAVRKCAEIYINAYGEAPWNEKYKVEEVEKMAQCCFPNCL